MGDPIQTSAIQVVADPFANKVKAVFGIFAVILVLAVLGLAGFGIYTLQQNQAVWKQIAEANKILIEQNKKLDDRIAKRDENLIKLIADNQRLQDDKERINKEKQDIIAKYDKIKNDVNKPLPKNEQDTFFFAHKYQGSVYQNNGGRLFDSPDTVKLQTDLVELDKLSAAYPKCEEQVGVMQLALQNYDKQIKQHEGIRFDLEQKIKNDETALENKDKIIVEKDKEVRRTRVKKWITVVVTGLISGGVGYAAHH